MDVKERKEYIQETFKILREPMLFGPCVESPLGFCLTTNLNFTIATEMQEIIKNIIDSNIDEKIKILPGHKVFVMLHPRHFDSDKELIKVCFELKNYIQTRLKDLSIFRRENEEEIIRKAREDELRKMIRTNRLFKEIYYLGYKDGKRS